MNGYDLDGVLTAGIFPEKPFVIISGRTFSEYDEVCKKLAQEVPVYIRGFGRVGDNQAAGYFKGIMICELGIKTFYEDNDFQAQEILNVTSARKHSVKIIMVKK